MIRRAVLYFLAGIWPALAQTPAISLADAVAQASATYPSVRVSQSQVNAAAAGIQLARTAYLPRVDAIAGLNRATRNNVFGLLLPSQVIAPISGPVLGTNDLTNVWGSTAGVLATWEPFDFGLRQANVNIASAARDRASAALARSQFEVATLAADAYLTILAADETVKAAQAGVERSNEIERVVSALVRAELRPGVEESRTRAEAAAAKNQVIQAKQAAAIARVTLAQLLNLPAVAVIVPSPLPTPPPESAPDSAALADNPLAREQSSAIAEAQAREKALERSYFPRFQLQGALYARGSGANPDGSTGGAFAGAGPNIQNWGAGLSINFPLFDLPALKARKDIENAHEQAERARYALVLRELNGRVARAQAALDAARQLAANAPIQLTYARAANEQSLARYRAGLSSIVDVADAQRVLTQAEIDVGLARLGVWRALLTVAAAQGNLEPFLRQVKE